MFLTSDEVKQLTGRTKPKLQREWLIEQGYRFDVRADGRPSVLSSQVIARQGGVRESRAEPNWDALR